MLNRTGGLRSTLVLLLVAVTFARYATSIPPARMGDRLTAYTWQTDRDSIRGKSRADLWRMKFSHRWNTGQKEFRKQKDTLIRSVLSLRALITRYTLARWSIVLARWFKFIRADALLLLRELLLCGESGGVVSTSRQTSFSSGSQTSIEVQFMKSGKIKVYIYNELLELTIHFP